MKIFKRVTKEVFDDFIKNNDTLSENMIILSERGNSICIGGDAFSEYNKVGYCVLDKFSRDYDKYYMLKNK